MSITHWWTRWREVVQRLLAIAASVGSLAALLGRAIPELSWTSWHALALIATFVISMIAVILLELRSVHDRHVYQQDDVEGIRTYMKNWIRKGGRVAIWTRDMTWAQEDTVIALLYAKARAGELVLCLPASVSLTERLKAEGAEVYAYGSDTVSPTSRFTIAHYGRDGARVAVGRAVKRSHVIDEFDSGAHPAFYIAQDLIRLAQQASRG